MRKKPMLAFVCVFFLLSAGLFAAGNQEKTTPSAETTKGGATNANPLSDVRVRQAIAYAIDMDTIAKTLLEGKALPANSMTPNGAWKTSGLNSYAYNPKKAKELLSAAKWNPNNKLDLVYYYADQQTVDLMTAIQAYLADVGIKMEFRKLEGDLAAQLWVKPQDPVLGPSAVNWDMCYGAIAALAMHEYYNRFKTAGSGNSHTPGSPELDKLIDATNATSDPVAQKAAFAALQKYENENLFAIPLYYQQLFIYQSTRLDRAGGEYGNDQYNYDWNIVNWTVPADASGKKVLYSNTAPVEFFETPWFNPGLTMGTKVLFDRLIVADGSITPKKGQLAADYKVSADNMSVTFTLKNGLKWHDGSDLTAADVKWSIEFATKVTALHPVIANTFMSIKGAEAYKNGSASEITGIAVSGNKVTINFEKLDPNMLLSFTQFSPLPKKYFESTDPLKFQQSPFWQKPVGSGPFMLKEVQMNDYTVMVPFKQYHGGVAKLDEIVLYPSGENDGNVLKNAAAGKLDYGFTKNVGDVKALEAMSTMKVVPVDIPYTRLLFINKFPRK